MTRLFKKDRLKSILTRFVFFYAGRAESIRLRALRRGIFAKLSISIEIRLLLILSKIVVYINNKINNSEDLEKNKTQQNQKDTKEKQGYSIDESTPIFIVDDQVFDTTLYVIDNNCKYYAASKNGIKQEWSPKYFLH
jgi:hypothetical protein